MPRANRHHIPGQVWHITHRCHKKEFLLKFPRDRRRWLHWLFESKKRYGLQIFDYTVTSNHIHLLVLDSDENVIPKSLQLAAGKTAQEYNQRKNRKGAFWDDRYHATAIETGEHLFQCLVYIDLNMLRNGVVEHPSQWVHSGYNEIQNPPSRYALIDRKQLIECCGMGSDEQLCKEHREWVEEAIAKKEFSRKPELSESIAVGSKAFVENVGKKLKPGLFQKTIEEIGSHYALREPEAVYNAGFGGKNGLLNPENSNFLPISHE